MQVSQVTGGMELRCFAAGQIFQPPTCRMEVSCFSARTAMQIFHAAPSSSEKLQLSRTNFNELKPCNFSPFPVRSDYHVFRKTGFQVQRQILLEVFCSKGRETSVVETGSMEEVYDILAERLVPTAAAASNSNYKHIVGLAGPPGAGKSTIAHEVAQRINKLWPQKSTCFDSEVEASEIAVVLPMDGFHLYRHLLDAMESPDEAHARRGAPWTFNPEMLLKCLKTLKEKGTVYVPSFDHGVGDPVEDDIFVDVRHKVVIVEGNYLLLEDGLWKDISTIFDERFVDVELDVAMRRVLKRYLSTGKPPEVAKWRIDYNDRPNAELILESKKNSDLIVKSVDLSK